MPSPFPGMDPFIESQVWGDFHHAFIEATRESLITRVRPRYVVLIEERIYVEHRFDGTANLVIPDVAVLQPESVPVPPSSPGSMVTAALTPVEVTLPIPEPRREAYLTVRKRETWEIVTVIEVLSPDNKRPGADGRREYLSKREAVLQSPAHLVEFDLLRGGARLPTLEPLPPADYYAFVCRTYRRPKAEVYAWSVTQPLPSIPIPLASDDPDATLDLQAVFTTVYDRAGYDYILDYQRPIEPPLPGTLVAWAQQVLTATR